MRLPHRNGREDRAADRPAGLRLPDWLQTSGRGAWLLVGVALLGAIVLLLLGLISDLVIPLIFASILAAIFVPLVDRLERWRLPRWLGAPLVVLLVIGVVLVVVWMVVAGILDQGGEILARVSAGFDQAGTPVEPSQQDIQEAVKIAGELVATLVGGLLQGLGSVTVLIVGLVTGLFILLFLLKDWPVFYEGTSTRIAALLGLPGDIGRQILSDTVHAFRGYAFGADDRRGDERSRHGSGSMAARGAAARADRGRHLRDQLHPFFGAFFAGAFAVLIALGANGLGTALAILAIALLSNNTLQNLLETGGVRQGPAAAPAGGAAGDDRRHAAIRDPRCDARGAGHRRGAEHPQDAARRGPAHRGSSRRVASWLARYEWPWLRWDLLAGLTTAAVVVHQAVAYLSLAGMPVQVGLYVALAPMLVYAPLGTSRPLSVSSTSTISILTASVLAEAGAAADPGRALLVLRH